MSNKRTNFCGSPEHGVSRRGFLGAAAAAGAATFAADMTVLDALKNPVLAGELKKQQKQVIVLWLAGGASQLETWDPKPGRPTGGPFRPIQTSVSGIEISELLPKMAARMGDTAIIRSLNTRVGDHGGGSKLMTLGRRPDPVVNLPEMGAVVARELGRIDSQVPDYVTFYSSTEGRGNAVGMPGFLGARYAPMFLTENSVPNNLRAQKTITEVDHQDRAALRNLLAQRFSRGRNSGIVASHNSAYQRVRGLMASEKLFDVAQEPANVRATYGPTQFGEQCLIARRLIEAGVPFVALVTAMDLGFNYGD